MRSARGQSEREPKPHKLQASSSMPSFFFLFLTSLTQHYNLVALTLKISLYAVK